MERPERIHASILGLAAAYVRLGGRHADGKAAPHPRRDPASLTSIPFRVHKTDRTMKLTSEAVTAVHGLDWMKELSIMCAGAETKLALNGKELVRPIAIEQAGARDKAEKPKLHDGDLYLCSESLHALEGALGGVCDGVDEVFTDKGPKRAFVCIRPPGHHCSADYPSGFCWLNNVHVGVKHASLAHGLTHAAIIDFDLHHGDGSQSIAWMHNSKVNSLPRNTPPSKKTAIGYFSLHDINSYPCEMGDEEKVRNASLCLENAHGQTVWNVHLQPWKTESEFWDLYENRYSILFSKARDFLRSYTSRIQSVANHPGPKAMIFLSAGFDASEWESPGMQRHKVNVPTDFYARFTRDVVNLAEEEGLGVDGRIVSVLEGGYSDRALTSGVLSHLSGLTTACELTENAKANGLAQEMGRRLGKLDLNSDYPQAIGNVPESSIESFQSGWWALPNLQELETLVHPPPPLPVSKKARTAAPPTYSSHTQSYTAKIISPPQNRRSLSGSGMPAPSYFRPITPPPPDVDWATAAYELSKLLIPSDRQTRSCKPEDLNAEASRTRRDRQSTIGLPADLTVPDGKRMQLRDRTSKVPNHASEERDGDRPVSRANRRRTIAGVASLGQETPDQPPAPAPTVARSSRRPAMRRVSMASSTASLNGERTSSSTSSVVQHEARNEALIHSDETPSDSFSVRPSSALSNQHQPDLSMVKKTRVPRKGPTEAPKSRPIKRLPSVPVPIPRIPSSFSTTERPKIPPRGTSALPLPLNEDAKRVDLDNLTSGLKKMSIKLRMPSKEEQEAREAKQKPAPKGRPRVSGPKTTSAVDIAQPSEVVQPTTGSPTTAGKLSAVPVDAEIATYAQAPMSPSPMIEDLAPELEPLQDGLPPDLATHQFASAPPASFQHPTPTTIPAPTMEIETPKFPMPIAPTNDAHSQEVPTTMPVSQPHSSAIHPPPSTPKRTKQDLPIFTATSPIIFGKPSTIPFNINNQLTQHPEPPKTESGVAEGHALATQSNGTSVAAHIQDS